METNKQSAAATGTKTKTATTATPDTTSTKTKTPKTDTETKATAQTPETGTQTPTKAAETGTAKTTEDTTSTETKTAKETTEDAIGELALDYLAGGYYKGEGKSRYPNPVLVDQAETIGKSLAAGEVTVTMFNRMLRTLKAAKNKPFEAQEGALKKLIVQVIDLENRKKAPSLLREIVERNRTEVQNAADFVACLDHFKDIATFLAAAQK